MSLTPLRTAPRLDRLDRHVGRSVVRVKGRASSEGIAYRLEQALRLMQLPGECEGRIYCFRSVKLEGLGSRQDVRVWTEQTQRRLASLAVHAVLGTMAGARSAQCVYFHNAQQALETLLGLVLRSAGPSPWFSCSILGLGAEAGRGEQILTLLERLKEPPIPLGAGPQILLAALGDSDPTPLLAAIPAHTVRAWIGEWEGKRHAKGDSTAVTLHGGARTTLERAAQQFGWRDLHTLWLCGQIVMAQSSTTHDTVLGRARATLRLLEEADKSPRTIAGQPVRHDSSDGVTPPGRKKMLIFDEDRREDGALHALPVAGEREDEQSGLRKSETVTPTPAGLIRGDAPSYAPAESTALIGEPTQAGGLYFLVPVLRHLGVDKVMEFCPALQEAGFPQHLLNLVGTQCGVTPDDAALAYLKEAATPFLLVEGLREDQRAVLWPPNMPGLPRVHLDADALLRLWAVAVRRWCRRTGGLSAKEIVLHPGRVWTARAELDLTLPLSRADVRIRRIGLDIDPGWVPWLGRYGTVVRFHYGEMEAGGTA